MSAHVQGLSANVQSFTDESSVALSRWVPPIGCFLFALFCLEWAHSDRPLTFLPGAVLFAVGIVAYLLSKKLRSIALKNHEFVTYDSGPPVIFALSDLSTYSLCQTRAGMKLTLKSKAGNELQTLVPSDKIVELSAILAQLPRAGE